jgi:transcriptional regulator with XRE-family HTH domain
VAKNPSFETFGRRVRERRLAAGLSQEALGDRSGIHRTYVGGVERGERNLALANILRLAAALAVDPGDLVTGLRAPPAPRRRSR